MPSYRDAVEIAIEESELGISPYTWDNCPFADVRYGVTVGEDDAPFSPEDTVPFSPEDEREAVGFFEDSDFPDIDEWLVNLSDRDFYTMKRAIDDIRDIAARASRPLPMPVLAGWIDL